MTSGRITDPYFRRLRRALRKAENFMRRDQQSPKAAARWNRVINTAIREGAL